MFNLSETQRVTIKNPNLNDNSLKINELKVIYKKILANIMSKNEVRALFWINELKKREIKKVSKNQELIWLFPWPCTLIESAEATGNNRVKIALHELV